MKRKVISLILITVASINLCGCTPITTTYEIESFLEFTKIGDEPMIDENDVTGELIEGTLSNTEKEQERIDAKSEYTEEEKKRDELVKANGGISSSVDLDKEYEKRQNELKNDQEILDKKNRELNNPSNNTDTVEDDNSYGNFFDDKKTKEDNPSNDKEPSIDKSEFVKEDSYSIWDFLKEKFGNAYNKYKYNKQEETKQSENGVSDECKK